MSKTYSTVVIFEQCAHSGTFTSTYTEVKMAPWQHFQLCILNIWDLDPVFEKRDPDPVKNGLQHCTLHNSSVSLYVNPRILLIFFTVLHSEP